MNGRRIRQLLGAALYYGLARHLPGSFAPLRLGQRAFRGFCARLMLSRCGRDANVERGAVFSSRVTLGDHSGIGINAQRDGRESWTQGYLLVVRLVFVVQCEASLR